MCKCEVLLSLFRFFFNFFSMSFSAVHYTRDCTSTIPWQDCLKIMIIVHKLGHHKKASHPKAELVKAFFLDVD